MSEANGFYPAGRGFKSCPGLCNFSTLPVENAVRYASSAHGKLILVFESTVGLSSQVVTLVSQMGLAGSIPAIHPHKDLRSLMVL